jgi:hypothetical protein
MTTNNDANEPGAPVQTATLNEKEVIERLGVVKESDVTDEIYSFGQMMVDEVVDRLKTLETKATWIAAYSIGLITILVSIQAKWTVTFKPWAASAMVLSGVIAFAAAATAVSALSLKLYPFFSHNEWMKADCLNNADRLRRYHVVVMHGVHDSYQNRCDSTAARISTAQSLLLLSALLLVLALALSAFSPYWVASR